MVMTIMHTAATKWESAKPIVIALAIGLVVGPLVSNFMGWQVTSGNARAQIHASAVEAQALVCAALARIEVSEPGKLDWSARNDLAKKWAVMPGAATADSDVISACSGKLAG
jgi:hypothetical protein